MGKTNKAWINVLLLAVTLMINTLGATGRINGMTQKQISDMYITLITPSPSTFSIWGIIYALLLISMVVMIVKKNDPYYQNAADQISVLFWISCILNIAWIVSFSFVLVELSVLFILGFVITLALICLKLAEIHDGKRWLLPLSFGLYTGWLIIATVVNISSALVKLKWNGFGIADETWAAVILIAGVFLALALLLKFRNAVYPLPIAWAYWGIYTFLAAPEGFKGEYGLLQIIALAGMAALILLAVIQFYRNRCALLPKP